MDSQEGHADGVDPATDNPSRALWKSLNEVMLAHMATITLRSLVDEQQALGATIADKPVRQAVAAPSPVKRVITNAPNSVFAFGRSFER
jgi:Rrf2 family iron-sulfur cluster assembly transcriptional regulator